MKQKKMGRPRKMSPQQTQKALEWASIGTGMAEASKHFGVARSTLRNALIRAREERNP